MAWFRAATVITKRKLLQRSAWNFAPRIQVLSSQQKTFHATNFTPKSQVVAPSKPSPVPLSRLTDSFLYGSSSTYLEELQKAWEADPSSVDESWDIFFRNYIGHDTSRISQVSTKQIQESMSLMLLVRAYQMYGHMIAKLDPLELGQRQIPQELDPANYGFTESDLDREFFLGAWKISGILSENQPVRTLRSILTRLEKAYCGTIGYEYMHIADTEKCNWLRDRIESEETAKFDREHCLVILERLAWSLKYEMFLGTKWSSAKRFGLEGAETLIPGLQEVIDRAADFGAENVVLGTTHRGRVNALGTVVKMPLRRIFCEFNGTLNSPDERGYTGTGDVKHHLGASYDHKTRNSKNVHISLVPNPSHLEAVDPVVEGKTRAKQYFSNDSERIKNISILIHGDGSLPGQGVAYESLHLSALPNYSTGGTVHLVLNNQVAFTTDPDSGRSSQYCTDIAKAFDSPVFHVNGDDMEAVARACQLAAEWRQTFHSDAMVDVVCYRRFGHNEVDEPFLTQPMMYKVIKNHPTALDFYEKKLVESGVVTQEEVDGIHKKINKILNDEFLASKDHVPDRKDWLSANWTGFKSPDQLSPIRNTGVKIETLKKIGKSITTLPDNITPHRAVKKFYEQRVQMLESGEGIDWGFAEALAFATLIAEGNHVRLSGQDVERGTFSHRHAIIHDQQTGVKYCPLDHVNPNQRKEMFTVSNSTLSEYGVMGFEFGYSMENPHSLVMWEAQFGDFANGGQVIIDNFLSSCEAKWLRQNGLVLLLPHGYDGQGPEHSSARLERFLQMSNENPFVIPEMDPKVTKQIQECNWQVVNITTPANYFHVLRRQIHREFRKPLIVMSPKNLLRHKECKSKISEFVDVEGNDEHQESTKFMRLIKDKNNHSQLEEGVRRVILCSGKVYYDLDEERGKINAKDIAICRVEQLCPFPYDLIQQELKRYPNAEIVWCQEEPMNMGAYYYMLPRLWTSMKTLGRGSMEDIKYVGRDPAAATATGFYKIHQKEQSELVHKAMQNQPIHYPF
ncbi:hypothetical protein HN51_068117 [Arachis hypogaea]|uniref:2-oxoglutarate dehydrogenase, mitochondrial n=1 Tax=Arachis hypogaea TaxID=3818 RepID=A0A445DAE0_ARAHY|nr:2-oxoglutarate dehydrogenase, mitochondrial [Arachis ipaensis]XP_025650397.1 2-oxoglutarate dehydrogenase, mitochondrial-like [Arachis hypogaea]XP_025697121.1 2-oxoglutarate dehydrogenase, mitochondrial-like [Arachis hypogaea]QHO09859.1 2-oxoglutarate dehydrogenase [Arachis hypogaea]RYR60116.1 hypothetical protein Ahy_A04g017207 isoform A [Arachis hypogaea]